MTHDSNNHDLQPTTTELELIDQIRRLKIDIPNRDELYYLQERRKLKIQQDKLVSAYLAEHRNKLSAAISKLLGTFLYYEDAMDHPEAQYACVVLYHFNELLLPPHSMYE